MSDFKLDDYVDVAERLRQFYEKYPDGRVTRLNDPRVMEVEGKTFIVYDALAYRAPDDPTPCIGTAWEPFPGRTPYTRDSELMNAETAAWGRAIVAAGIPSKRVASRDEAQAREGNDAPAEVSGPTPAQQKYLKTLITKSKAPPAVLRVMLDAVGAKDITVSEGWVGRLSRESCSALLEWFKERPLPDPEHPSNVPAEFPAPDAVDYGELPFTETANAEVEGSS
jgi:hypothetical protein